MQAGCTRSNMLTKRSCRQLASYAQPAASAVRRMEAAECEVVWYVSRTWPEAADRFRRRPKQFSTPGTAHMAWFMPSVAHGTADVVSRSGSKSIAVHESSHSGAIT